MNDDPALLEDSAEELFEDAPCGYLTTQLDGTIMRVNRTFEAMTGLAREDLVGRRRFQELLSPGGRIYHETHYAPLLRMQGSVREIALEVVCADGARLPALVNSVLRPDAQGNPRAIRTSVFDATARRGYERELVEARRREQGIALELQRSLLSGLMPTAPGLDLAVTYRPAVLGLEVGGDWYDAFWLDEQETLGLVVGDVVGRGIAAAATMGQLRSAVRALASTGLGPAQVLEALDGYARRHDVGQMTTLIYAQLELASGRLTFACAGHPPPVFVSAEGVATIDWAGRSLPLDAYMAGPREETSQVLAPGTSVLFYTDGLVERRVWTLDEGLEALVNGATRHHGESAEALGASLVRALVEPEQADDVCLLVARLLRP